MSRSKDQVPVTRLESQSQIEALCDQCRRERRFAFDTEFVTEDRFAPEVCLIQIAVSDRVALVDPFLNVDLRPVWNLVCDPKVETVVHAGQEDLGLCVQHVSEVPQNIFDVQIAAGLVKGEYPLNLQKLVQLCLHVRLHKSKTLTDWRKRPLKPEQLSYAAEDVLHLLELRDRLGRKLDEMGRTQWAREEFAAFEDPKLYHRAEQDKLRRIKGSGALRGRHLAVLREILPWRDEVAARRNRPPRSVIKDHLIVEIAKLGLSSFEEIRELRGINLGDRDVRALCAVIRNALRTPQEDWPQPQTRERETPEEEMLATLISAVLRSFCNQNAVAYGLLATKRAILELIRFCIHPKSMKRSEVALLRDWRGEAVGKLLIDLLNGRNLLRVKIQDRQPTLTVVTPPEDS